MLHSTMPQTYMVFKTLWVLLCPLFSERVSFGITGVGITLNDAMVSDAKFSITGVGITLSDAMVSDATVSITGVGITFTDAKGE